MWKNMVEPDRPQVIMWRVCFACWITKATHTHTQYLLLFHSNNGYANVPHCYVIHTLPVLFQCYFQLLCHKRTSPTYNSVDKGSRPQRLKREVKHIVASYGNWAARPSFCSPINGNVTSPRCLVCWVSWNYIDITKHTYIPCWTITCIMMG